MSIHTHWNRKLSLVLAALVLTAMPAMTPAQRPDPDEMLSVIVSLEDAMEPNDFAGRNMPRGRLRAELITALKARAETAQRPLKAFLRGRGVEEITTLWLLNAIAVTAPAHVVQELSRFPGVLGVRPDARVQADPAPQGEPVPAGWNLEMVRAPELWALGATGTGVVVANLDTGVDVRHADLAASWRGGANSWYDPNGQYPSPFDGTGHGTGTMGLIVGGSAGGSAIGMAPGAKWIAAKIFNNAGSASYSAIHAAFQWVLDPDGVAATDDAAHVVNNSWGFEDAVNTCNQEFEQDLKTLKAAGIAVVFSAGNQGPSGSSSVSPANNISGFASGALDINGIIADFSSRGPSTCGGSVYPEITAPGVGVRTASLTSGGAFPQTYTTATGTSFAAPHISGAMALLLSRNPAASVAELEYSLKNASRDLGSPGPDNTYGQGLLDVFAASALLGEGPDCIDNDGDGFFGAAGCGTVKDCNDYDPRIHPAACDIIGDGIDQNCDGLDRLKGKACPTGGGGGTTPGSEGSGNTCSDGIDNDGDGRVDCADSDCARNKKCR